MFVGAAELLQAANVDHVLTAAILHAGQENLILIKSKVLEIYDTTSDRLHLLSYHRFAEPIRGIQRLSPTNKAEPDRLVLCFAHKNFSVVRYSRKINDFVTLSMHSFDNELLLGSSTDLTKKKPISSDARLLHVDPESRCVLYRLDCGNWALLGLEEEGDDEKRPHQQSLTFPSSKIDERIKNVVDFCFLEGFYEPTIAVLFEPTFAWPGRLPVAMDTMELIITTLNLKSRTFTAIHHQTKLPNESRVLKPIPKPIGGVLLVGPNLFVHADHISSPTYKAINYFAELTSSSVPSIPVNPAHGKESCVPSSIQMITKERAVWASESGKLFWLSFKSGSRAVSSLDIQAITTDLTSSASCIAKVGADRLFIGSAFDNHRVYRLNGKKEAEEAQTMSKGEGDDDLDSFYREEILGEQSAACELELCAELPSMGSAASFALGKSNNAFDIYAVGGFRDTGFLNIISMGLKGKDLTSFELEDSTRLFVIQNSYLVISTPHSTMLMRTSAESMTEIEETAFFLQCQTLLAASLGPLILQVCERKALLFSQDTKSRLTEATFKTCVKSVEILGNLLVALLTDGSLELYRVSSEGSFDPVMLDSSFAAHHIDLIAGEALADGKILLALFADSRDLIIMTVSEDDQIVPCFSTPLLPYLPRVMSSQALRSLDLEHVDQPKSISFVSSADKFAMLLVVTTADAIICYRLAEENKLIKVCSGTPIDFEFHSPPTKFNAFLDTNGLLFPGTTPTVLCIGSTGYPRLHRLIHPDSLLAMNQFGPNRLALLNVSGKISIAQFDLNTQLDYQVPFIRKAFSERLHGIIYNASSNTFTVATSQADSFKFPEDEYSALTDNLEWKPPAHIERAELSHPSISKMSLKLLSPTSWSFVDEFAVEPFEHITALETCSLSTKETTKGSKSFICVGATAVKGEDRPVRGRVLIFDIMDVVPEPGRPETNVKFKQLLSSDMKLPVSGLTDIDGYLAVSLGVKTIIHEFEDNETLNGVAFTDCGVYITSTLILKKYLVLGDIKRGLNFYGFQEKPPKVLELGRDLAVAPKPVVHSAALLDGQEVLFVAAGEDGLLSFFVYSPATSAERLVKRGCYDLHEPVSKMIRVVLEDTANIQHATLYMTVKGEIGLLTPLSESRFRTLYPAQNRISQEMPQPAGLHPRASRGSPTAKSVLDLGLLAQAVDFPVLAQRALSDEETTASSVIRAIYKPFIDIFRKFE